MRLIDADALKKYKFTTQTYNGVEPEDIDVVCVGAIDNAPTIIERPKGKWITDELSNTVCSICGGIRRDNRVDYIDFCNKCGAHMVKEDPRESD